MKVLNYLDLIREELRTMVANEENDLPRAVTAAIEVFVEVTGNLNK